MGTTPPLLVSMALAVFAVFVVPAASGQTYPSKLIRIFATSTGSANDFLARLIAQGIAGNLGQPIVVENRPNAVLGEALAKAAPDGYTLYLASGITWIGPLLRKMPYDPVTDFTYVTLVSSSPTVLVVHPSVPVKSVKELIVLGRARPGELNYASGGSGSTAHLATELFKSMANVDFVRVFYKGTGQALTDLVGGHVQLMFVSGASVSPQLKAGKLKALAVSSSKSSALYPGLPTIAASGLPGYESGINYGVIGPAKIAEPIVNRLNQEFVRFVRTAETKEKLINYGTDPNGSSPQEFFAAIKDEMSKMGKVIRDEIFEKINVP